MLKLEETIKSLKKYFAEQPNVSMAFVFGSFANGRAMAESDFDIAVYFKPKGKEIEWETEKEYKGESKIWLDVEKIVKRNVDLLILNRASSTVAFEVLRTNKPIIVKDKMLYWRFFSIITFEAIDFMDFVDDYRKIAARSASLNRIDRERLIRLEQFLNDELKDRQSFNKLDWQTYRTVSSQRRNVERWVENIANCSIDIAKILLASENMKIPDTYRDTLKDLSLLPKFKMKTALKLAEFAGLRNVPAHQYLDIRFDKIKKFIKESDAVYEELLKFVKKILK